MAGAKKTGSGDAPEVHGVGGQGSDAGPMEGPIELTDEASQLDLEDDDPPLPWLQGDEDEEEFEGQGIGQTIAIVLLGLLAIAVVVGGIWWVMHRAGNDALLADGSTIEAPDTPYKTKPADPGGKVFEGTGDSSFGISEGQKRPARLGQQALPPSKPALASAGQGDKRVETAAAGGQATAAAEAPGVGVQVAAYSNREQAEAGWTRLSQQYELLADAKHRVVQGQADIGTVYRLQAIAPDVASAKALCQKLKATGLNCQVKQ